PAAEPSRPTSTALGTNLRRHGDIKRRNLKLFWSVSRRIAPPTRRPTPEVRLRPMPQPDIPSSRSRARARLARRRNPRRWLTAGALLTLIALGIVLVSGFATANPHLKLARAPDAAPSIPHSRQRLPYG